MDHIIPIVRARESIQVRPIRVKVSWPPNGSDATLDMLLRLPAAARHAVALHRIVYALFHELAPALVVIVQIVRDDEATIVLGGRHVRCVRPSAGARQWHPQPGQAGILDNAIEPPRWGIGPHVQPHVADHRHGPHGLEQRNNVERPRQLIIVLQ